MINKCPFLIKIILNFFFNFCINRKINSIFLKQILKKNEKQGHELLDQTHK